MQVNSWLYELYSLQAKMQYGLTIGQPGLECSDALLAMCGGSHDLSPEERLRYYAQMNSPSESSQPIDLVAHGDKSPTPGSVCSVKMESPDSPALPNSNSLSTSNSTTNNNSSTTVSTHHSNITNNAALAAGFTPPSSQHSLSSCSSPNAYIPVSSSTSLSSSSSSASSTSNSLQSSVSSHYAPVAPLHSATAAAACATAAAAGHLMPMTPLQLNNPAAYPHSNNGVLPYSPAAGCLPYGTSFVSPNHSQMANGSSSPAGAIIPTQMQTRLPQLHSPPSGSVAATPPATPPDAASAPRSAHPTKRTLATCNRNTGSSNGSHSPEAKRAFFGQSTVSDHQLHHSHVKIESSPSIAAAAAAYYGSQYPSQYTSQYPSQYAHTGHSQSYAAYNTQRWLPLNELMPMSSYYQNASHLSAASPMLHNAAAASTTAAVAAAAAAAAVAVANSTGTNSHHHHHAHSNDHSPLNTAHHHASTTPSSTAHHLQHQLPVANAAYGIPNTLGQSIPQLSANSMQSTAANAAAINHHHHHHHHSNFKLNYHVHAHAWPASSKRAMLSNTDTEHQLTAAASVPVPNAIAMGSYS